MVAQPLQGDGLLPAATGSSSRVGQRGEFLPPRGSESHGSSWAGVPWDSQLRGLPGNGKDSSEEKVLDPRMPRVCGPNGKWPARGDTSPAFKEAHSEVPSGWSSQEPHIHTHTHTHTHTNDRRNPLQTPRSPESTMPHPNGASHVRPSCPLASSRSGGEVGRRSSKSGVGERCHTNEIQNLDVRWHVNCWVLMAVTLGSDWKT